MCPPNLIAMRLVFPPLTLNQLQELHHVHPTKMPSLTPSSEANGVALLRQNGIWAIFLEDEDTSFNATLEDLVDIRKYYIQPMGNSMSSVDKQRQANKLKHLYLLFISVVFVLHSINKK